MSQLGIRYRRSPLSCDEPGAPRRGPRAGDRLPDAPVGNTTLHRLTAAPGWHLLLCGPAPAWPPDAVASLTRPGRLTVHRVTAADGGGPALRRLGLAPDSAGLYLVRPDGHIGYRAGGGDLRGLTAYVSRWVG
ncbi:aromatic-ring hydroxylase C-terminal domain-containing protein [Micromonospora thermarum]|uniref:aromatic-ring hydroxylase C-terminal domain-containing protein n=1 Tax=Micromonospora thermarum TaxID=2720024 RepID=UPI0035A1CEB2